MVKVFVTLIVLSPMLAAQELPYSADSLMATFDRGSKTSVKGNEITLHDIVADNRSSRLTFKASPGDRVICELTPSGLHGTQPAVGSAVTVTGKVRGRGVLGNVTLDNCKVTTVPEAIAVPAIPVPVLEVLPEPVAIAPPDVISEEVPLPVIPVADRATEPAKKIATTRSVPEPVLPAPRAVPLETTVTEPNSNQRASRVPYVFYALLVLSGAVGSSILSKVLGAALRSRPAVRGNSPEVRQAALQALLMKAEKKR
jgi:hypothetical protein